jgi:acetylornithine deacetylase/succinyl-diaminopimelate desuccinylase-like protein
VQAQSPEVLARAIYRELVEIDTTQEHGTTPAAQAMAARLRAAGLPATDVQLVGPDPRKLNLVARLRGSGARQPLLLLAHLDVVAPPEDGPDLFRLVERNGAFFGRGTVDDKAMAALWIATILQLRREGYTPDRDLIVALTADEEEGDDNGVLWLVRQRRELVDAAYCLNEGGTGELRNGRYLANEIQVGEKTEATFRIVAHGPGGNSAQPPLPGDKTAIERLTAGLVRLSAHRFPLRLSELVRSYFLAAAPTAPEPVQRDMLRLGRGPLRAPDGQALQRVAAASSFYNTQLRTTCAITLLQGGYAESSVPETAEATVNCRLLPDESVPALQQTLERVLADPQLQLTLKWPPQQSPTSPLLPELWDAVTALTASMWPQAAVVPLLLPASSDGRHLRTAGIPTYGVSGLFVELDEAPEHSATEHLGVRQFFEGQRFLYRLVKALSSGPRSEPRPSGSGPSGINMP